MPFLLKIYFFQYIFFLCQTHLGLQILNQTKEAVDESVEENQEKIDIVDKIQEKINEEKDAQDE